MLNRGMTLKKKIGSIFSRFSPLLSLATVATNGRKRFQCKMTRLAHLFTQNKLFLKDTKAGAPNGEFR